MAKDRVKSIRVNGDKEDLLIEAGGSVQSVVDDYFDAMFNEQMSLELNLTHSLTYPYKDVVYSFRTSDKGDYEYFKGVLSVLSIQFLKEESFKVFQVMSAADQKMAIELFRIKDTMNQIK